MKICTIKKTKDRMFLFLNIRFVHFTGCPSGYYGENCSVEFSQNWQDDNGDIVKGNCPGCKPSFFGPRCNIGK